MKYYWTRYLPTYPHTIIYMLQNSEYHMDDYFQWLRRTSDFRSVIKRRQLDYTKKVKLLLFIAWAMLIMIYAVVIYLILSANFVAILIACLLFVIAPVIVAYAINIPLLLGYYIIQKPKEIEMINKARVILANNKALKIAIAGSYGKTTAKEILRTIIGSGKKVAFTPGNMNTPIGISRFAFELDESVDVIIFELGEEKVGDVSELCDLVQPDIGVITGINEAHLSSFGTIDNTIATIFELKKYLNNKPLYKNKENSLVASRIKHADNLAFSRDGVNGWDINIIKNDINGISFRAIKNNKKILAHTKLLGLYNIGIIAVAIDIADSLGLTVQQIIDGIEKTVPFEHRMQPVNFHGAWLIDDSYNGNSDGVQQGLKLLGEIEANRRIYITPGLVKQGDKSREVHERIGEQIANVADVVVLMKNSVTDYILAGLGKAGYEGKLMIVDEPLEFYNNLESFVAKGDVVLMQNDWTDNYA